MSFGKPIEGYWALLSPGALAATKSSTNSDSGARYRKILSADRLVHCATRRALHRGQGGAFRGRSRAYHQDEKLEEKVFEKTLTPLPTSSKYEANEFCDECIRISLHFGKSANIIPALILEIFQLLAPLLVGKTRHKDVVKPQNAKEAVIMILLVYPCKALQWRLLEVISHRVNLILPGMLTRLAQQEQQPCIHHYPAVS